MFESENRLQWNPLRDSAKLHPALAHQSGGVLCDAESRIALSGCNLREKLDLRLH
jgi:hypothetical protein